MKSLENLKKIQAFQFGIAIVRPTRSSEQCWYPVEAHHKLKAFLDVLRYLYVENFSMDLCCRTMYEDVLGNPLHGYDRCNTGPENVYLCVGRNAVMSLT